MAVCDDYVVHPTCATTVRRYTDGMSTVYRWVEDERLYTVGGRTGQRPYVLTDEATYDQLLWESSQQQREACSRLWQRTAQAWADAGDHWTPDLATRGDAWACAAADREDEVRIQQEYEAYMAALDGTWQATWRTLDAYAGGPSVSELPLW